MTTPRVQLDGIWGFIPSPFTSNGRLDLTAVGGLAVRQVDGGVSVVCASGVIAQVEELTMRERVESTAAIVAAVRGRVPVIATVLADDTSPATSASLAEAGADGLLVVPREADLQRVYLRLDSIAQASLGLPTVLYHRPPLNLEPGDLQKLAEIEALVGVKDGHRDVRQFRRLRDALADSLVWVSAWEDVALPFWSLGCTAFAPASACYDPRYACAWLQSLNEGDVGTARALLEEHAYPFTDLRLSRANIDVSVVKEAMRLKGLPTGSTRPPAQPLDQRERQQVADLVGRLDRALEGLALRT